MFVQDNYIRDFVFPLAVIPANHQGALKVERILGTAFLIGRRGFAMTARHVLESTEGKRVVGMFALPDGTWKTFDVQKIERHPSLDVGLVQIDGGPWNSIFRLSNSWAGATTRYRCFGYPDDATFELYQDRSVLVRPDLVYTEGYIRRRFPYPLPTIRGDLFLELSDVAGSGCSGAPVFTELGVGWGVIGIYVCERLNDRGTSVAYAVMEEAFREWSPTALGRSVLQESQDI